MIRTLPIFLAFLLMGVADAMGPLSSAVKDNYKLSTLMATMMPFFVFIAFAVCSVPGGVMAARIGKKNVLLLGLGLNTIAVALPAFITPTYEVLLGCIFLLGVGTTFLQVAANPIMRDICAEGDYSRNLALAQGIKGVGSSVASSLPALIGGIGFLSAMGWRGSFPIFAVLMALAFVSVLSLKVKETKASEPPSIGSSLSLLGNPVFALAVLGIFCYVGAEVCMATFLNRSLSGWGFDDKHAAFFGATLFFGTLTVGRLIAGSVKVSPRTFFRLSALLGLIGLVVLMSGSISLAVVGVVLGGLGFANIWPMLFSITVEEKPERASELSGLMCMAISGGAIVPLLMAGLLDNFTNRFAVDAPVAQAVSNATGTVQSWDKETKVLAIKTLTGIFDTTNVISQAGAVKANARPQAIMGWTMNVTAGQFEKDSVVKQDYTTEDGKVTAEAKVVSWDATTKALILEPQKGVFINATNPIVQTVPAASATITGSLPVYTVVATDGGFAFVVPGACFAYLLLLAMKGGKKPTPAPAARVTAKA